MKSCVFDRELIVEGRGLADAKLIAEQHNVYLQSDVLPIRFLYSDENVDVIYFHGLSHGGLFYKSNAFNPNKVQIKIISLPWYTGSGRLSRQTEYLKELNDGKLDFDNTVVLANTFDELKESIELGFHNSILCNNNCWLDWRKFSVKQEKKAYDLVVNARPERWKRVNLAAEVERLAIIQGKNYRKNELVDYKLLNPKFLNDDRISIEAVFDIISKAYVGGCFSAEEGACYSSSEYLLSGLPVVSTKSTGGRDIWYTTMNSIIVEEPNPKHVKTAVDELVYRVASGAVDGQQIREQHIQLQRKFISTFVAKISCILNGLGIDYIDFGKVLSDSYYHKMAAFQTFRTKS